MKKSNFLLKISMLSLFLTIATLVAYAQTTPLPTTPVTVNADLKTGMLNDLGAAVLNADAVLFLNPTDGTSFTLTASEMDEAGENTFTDYAWYPVAADGTANTTTSLSSVRTLSRADMQPGYHRYRVFGFVNTPGIDCQSDEYQDFIVFILNPLSPTATETSAITEFCLGDTGTISLTANVNFAGTYQNADFSNPDADDFHLTYNWYAVLDGNTAAPIALGSASTINGATSSLTFDYDDLDEAGTYTFYVEVEYSSAIKDKGSRGVNHGFWRADVQSGGSAYELVVTPKPGRPTITIGTIVD